MPSDLDKALMCQARNDTCPSPAYCNVHTCRARGELEDKEAGTDPRDTGVDLGAMREPLAELQRATEIGMFGLSLNISLDREEAGKCMRDPLQINTETLSEHQDRLARSGLQPLNRKEAERLFPQHQVLNYFGR